MGFRIYHDDMDTNYNQPLPPEYYDEQNSGHTRDAGTRANAIATFGGLACLLTFLSIPGLILGFYFVNKAKKAGNPAVTGRIFLFLNILVALVQAFTIWQYWEFAQTAQEWQQMQQAR